MLVLVLGYALLYITVSSLLDVNHVILESTEAKPRTYVDHLRLQGRELIKVSIKATTVASKCSIML